MAKPDWLLRKTLFCWVWFKQTSIGFCKPALIFVWMYPDPRAAILSMWKSEKDFVKVFKYSWS